MKSLMAVARLWPWSCALGPLQDASSRRLPDHNFFSGRRPTTITTPSATRSRMSANNSAQIKRLLQPVKDIRFSTNGSLPDKLVMAKTLLSPPSSSYSYGKTVALILLSTIPFVTLLSGLHCSSRAIIPTELRKIVGHLLEVFSSCIHIFAPTAFLEQSPYQTYASASDEDKYWRDAESAARTLASSSTFAATPRAGRSGKSSAHDERPITYYAPKLLPLYREKRVKDPIASQYTISPKTFVKWHRMTFPDRVST